jgi:hypothetical protein
MEFRKETHPEVAIDDMVSEPAEPLNIGQAVFAASIRHDKRLGGKIGGGQGMMAR